MPPKLSTPVRNRIETQLLIGGSTEHTAAIEGLCTRTIKRYDKKLRDTGSVNTVAAIEPPAAYRERMQREVLSAWSAFLAIAAPLEVPAALILASPGSRKLTDDVLDRHIGQLNVCGRLALSRGLQSKPLLQRSRLHGLRGLDRGQLGLLRSLSSIISCFFSLSLPRSPLRRLVSRGQLHRDSRSSLRREMGLGDLHHAVPVFRLICLHRMKVFPQLHNRYDS